MLVRSARIPSPHVLVEGVTDGDVVFIVSLVREVRERRLEALEDERHHICASAATLGAKAPLRGAMPRDADGWSSQLGSRYEAIMRTKKLADPAGTLDSPNAPDVT